MKVFIIGSLSATWGLAATLVWIFFNAARTNDMTIVTINQYGEKAFETFLFPAVILAGLASLSIIIYRYARERG